MLVHCSDIRGRLYWWEAMAMALRRKPASPGHPHWRAVPSPGPAVPGLVREGLPSGCTTPGAIAGAGGGARSRRGSSTAADLGPLHGGPAAGLVQRKGGAAAAGWLGTADGDHRRIRGSGSGASHLFRCGLRERGDGFWRGWGRQLTNGRACGSWKRNHQGETGTTG